MTTASLLINQVVTSCSTPCMVFCSLWVGGAGWEGHSLCPERTWFARANWSARGNWSDWFARQNWSQERYIDMSRGCHMKGVFLEGPSREGRGPALKAETKYTTITFHHMQMKAPDFTFPKTKAHLP